MTHRRSSIRSFWRSMTRLAGLSNRRLWALGAVSTLAGFAEAAALLLVVKVTLGVVRGRETAVSLGPIGSADFSIPALLGSCLLLILVVQALQAASGYLSARMAADTMSALRRELFDRYIHASWRLQSGHREGELQELMMNHVLRVTMAIFFLAQGIVAVFNVLALTVSALVISPLGAVAILGAVVLLFFVLRPVTVVARRHARRQAKSSVDLAATVSDYLSISLEAKTFGIADALTHRSSISVGEVSRHFFRAKYLGNLVPDLYQNAAFVFVLASMAGVSYLTSLELASLGAVVLILLRALTFSRTMQQVFHQINEGMPFLEGIDAAQAAYEREAVPEEGLPLGQISRLEFDRVFYGYERERPVLKGVSFEVGVGEAVGIVGPTGAGKSTFVQVLLRLRSPDSGRYLVNGLDADTYSLRDWNQRVAVVPQDSHLFPASVADNIRFFRHQVTQEEIERAACMAHIHEDILSWLLGYETPVGARGGTLSGGQRQRISIARALAGQPDILILDEPTSALDSRSELLVQETLDSLKGRITMFIIAHRVSTLNICDRIMVFNQGRLQAFDRPTALLESNDFFQAAVAHARSAMG